MSEAQKFIKTDEAIEAEKMLENDPMEVIKAAAEGIGALKSATKSEIVKSVSCPTAEMIGIDES